MNISLLSARHLLLSFFVISVFLLSATGLLHAQSAIDRASEFATQAAHAMLAGKYNDALVAIRRAQQFDPNRPDYVEMEGTILTAWVKDAYAKSNTVLSAQYRAAMDAYERARGLFEEKGASKETILDLRTKKAELAMLVNDTNIAYRELQQILNSDPTNVPANYMIGTLLRNEYNRTGNENLYEASKQAFERAVVNNINGKHSIPYAYFYVGVSRMDARRDREALVYLQLWLHQIKSSGKLLDGMDRFMVELAEKYIDELR